MIPEIKLLVDKFSGEEWYQSDHVTQEQFMKELVQEESFLGEGSQSINGLSARDRIGRGPKPLGFVDLTPTIQLTPAGREFISGKRPQEGFLRQLLKFQLPSPFHPESKKIIGRFFVRPYLEIMRLVYDLGKLSFDECRIFVMQMTHYNKYDAVKAAILAFRAEKEKHKGKYKKLADDHMKAVVAEIFKEEIAIGKTGIRETSDKSINNFVRTKTGNFRDYADACFRYLRYTGLFVFSGHSLTIASEKMEDVKYLLTNTERNPVFVDDEVAYKSHLFSVTEPILYTDLKENIENTVLSESAYKKSDFLGKSIDELKDLRDLIIKTRKDEAIRIQINELKSYALHSEVVKIFNDIKLGTLDFYDAPLMFEYNTWRAMTMLNGGTINGNFKRDDSGEPLSTAQGNMADIECDYGEFVLTVEVTLQSGQRQYDAEGESVARHYARLRQKSQKDAYCLFVAKKINMATLEHFWGLNQIPNITAFGGKPKIIPLELAQFVRLVEISRNFCEIPSPADIRKFLQSAIDKIEGTTGAVEWQEGISHCVAEWLSEAE
jgi:hypothetical protein